MQRTGKIPRQEQIMKYFAQSSDHIAWRTKENSPCSIPSSLLTRDIYSQAYSNDQDNANMYAHIVLDAADYSFL